MSACESCMFNIKTTVVDCCMIIEKSIICKCPCKNCIVKSMCKSHNSCNIFKEFLHKMTKENYL